MEGCHLRGPLNKEHAATALYHFLHPDLCLKSNSLEGDKLCQIPRSFVQLLGVLTLSEQDILQCKEASFDHPCIEF